MERFVDQLLAFANVVENLGPQRKKSAVDHELIATHWSHDSHEPVGTRFDRMEAVPRLHRSETRDGALLLEVGNELIER
jgi:hypothetical protein